MKYDFVILIFFAFGVLSGFSQSEVYADTYTFVADQYPPYEYSTGGITQGLDYEILMEVAKHINMKIEVLFKPWARCVLEAKQGVVDGIFSIGKTPEREAFLLFPDTASSKGRYRLFANDKFKGDITRLSGTDGIVVGVWRGDSAGAEFDNYQKSKKSESTDGEMLFRKLSNYRHPLAMADELVSYYIMEKLGVTNVRPLTYIATEKDYYFGISKKSPRASILHKRISAALRDLEKLGKLDSIRQKYLN